MAEPKRAVRVSSSALYREVHGEAILLHLDSGEYFGLDAVGTRIWQLIVERGDLDDVRAAMLAEFDVDPVTLQNDLDRMVDELTAKRLIEIDSASSPHSR